MIVCITDGRKLTTQGTVQAEVSLPDNKVIKTRTTNVFKWINERQSSELTAGEDSLRTSNFHTDF